MRTAVVLGGGGLGIGGGISRALARSGHRVLVVDVDPAGAREVAVAIQTAGGESDWRAIDVRDHDALDQAVREWASTHGGLDALVCSVGVNIRSSVGSASLEDLRDLFEVNFVSAWAAAQTAIDLMSAHGGGSIVTIGSNHAVASMPGYGAYAATKAAITAMTRAIALDHGDAGIRCNCVHPGLVPVPATPGSDPVGEEAALAPDWVAHAQVLREEIHPDDIGEIVAFLAGPASRSLTGQTITVDAGTTLMLREEGH